MTNIANEAELQAFRENNLSGRALLDALEKHPSLLLSLPQGVGKSRACEDVTREALDTDRHDLVIYLTSQHRILEERLRNLDPALAKEAYVIKGRPERDCGPLNVEWERLLKKGCSHFAKATLCDQRCPLRSSCAWPEQLTEDALEGKRLILGTEDFLKVVHGFIFLLIQRTGAKRPLLILDEPRFLAFPVRHELSVRDIAKWLKVARTVVQHPALKPFEQRALDKVCMTLSQVVRRPARLNWKGYIGNLTHETLICLEEEVSQSQGIRNIYYPLLRLWQSNRSERAFDYDTDVIQFVASPLGLKYVPLLVIAPSLPKNLIGWHTNVSGVHDLFEGVQFKHAGTKVFNLKSSLGAKKYFVKNAQQLLYFFAQLIVRLNGEGKRVLLISKKTHATLCETELNRLFGKLGSSIQAGWVGDKGGGKAGVDVPIIHCGIEGVNDFEGFDAALCLNSYNANTKVLSDKLKGYFALEISPEWARLESGEYTARVLDFGDFQNKEVEALAASIARYHEATVVEQAVGRVRPFTRSRLVVTQQLSPLTIPCDVECVSLEALRREFDIPSLRVAAANVTADKVRDGRRRGLTQKQIAQETGLSLRTVKRYGGSRT